MTDEQIRQTLAAALVADPRTRGFVGIRAVTDVLTPVIRRLLAATGTTCDPANDYHVTPHIGCPLR